ncbi:hypothetical protein [Sorangium sp. So ce1151]|uniref:hypothetical protein n=1 Tax=Sorangium sp. So ce1151 TaxID=3133332 RepID=UPI003F5E4244
MAGTSGGAGAAGGDAAAAGQGGSAAGAGGEASGSGGAGDELVDCDPRKITCKRAAPECGSMQAPSVEGTCYGPCVAIERCACDAAEACPMPDQYTCWRKQHCGPYVN